MINIWKKYNGSMMVNYCYQSTCHDKRIRFFDPFDNTLSEHENDDDNENRGISCFTKGGKMQQWQLQYLIAIYLR